MDGWMDGWMESLSIRKYCAAASPDAHAEICSEHQGVALVKSSRKPDSSLTLTSRPTTLNL